MVDTEIEVDNSTWEPLAPSDLAPLPEPDQADDACELELDLNQTYRTLVEDQLAIAVNRAVGIDEP